MSLKLGTIGIIADDLTGANDTALQFLNRGCNTQILFDYTTVPPSVGCTQAWAISTETRNKKADAAVKIAATAAKMMQQNFNIVHFYKKMDSTLRGNVGQEAQAVLQTLNWNAVVVAPAFPTEGRTTVGGYHLLKGMPLERTEFARDPQSPITESHIPTLLKQQVDNQEIVAHIELMTVMQGAGPILMKLHELIKNNKKIISIDAVTTTDMEQIALAIEKSTYNILPCGSAGLAQALSKFWLPEVKHQHITKVLPPLPIFVVSGSATTVTQNQIKKLIESDELEINNVELTPAQILSEPDDEIISRISGYLAKNEIVLVHSAPNKETIDETLKYAEEKGIHIENIHSVVTDYLANLTKKVLEKQNAILVLVGGETSYKCCNSIDSKHLQLIDEVEPAIPLCLDHKAQWIVTKSGNLGNPNTLINILKYFIKHQETK